MTDQELRVLHALDCAAPCEMFFTFAGIMTESGLERGEVRTACRSLRTRGFAEFSNGLWGEDGQPAGSGYAITAAGAAARVIADQ